MSNPMLTHGYAHFYASRLARFRVALALLTLLSGIRTVAETLTLSAPKSTQASQPIAWAQLGAQATAHYSGNGLTVFADELGQKRLRCALQKLAGEVNKEGLWLTSTVEGATGTRFRVLAEYVGRDGSAMVALPEEGVVTLEQGRARYERRRLVEEYSVSADGVRQDFVVAEPPGGAGDLRVELAVSGARAEAVSQGVRLVVDGSGRKLAYSRLRAADAGGRDLLARIEVVADHRLAVVVSDAAALYPVRIDPTFSDANWVSLGGLPGDPPGASGTVRSAVVDGIGNLYVGGDFKTIDNVVVNYIAKWNGSTWSALGSGMNSGVSALGVSGTDLYVAGGFTTAGGVSATGVAKWDGSAWSALGSGVNGTIAAVVASATDVYVAGDFTTAGGVSANRVAKWDGSTWSALGSGMNGWVYALAMSGTDVYAGGRFTIAGGVNANRVARWNGSVWSALGSGEGLNGQVYALAVSGTDLYAGGRFTTADRVDVNHVGRWNGSAWSALGMGMNSDVLALAVSGMDIYAAGEFTTAGGVSANRAARWDGGAWSALGSGTDGVVYALTASGADVYAGGSFVTAGGVVINRIAKWDGDGWAALGSAGGVNPGLSYAVQAVAVAGTDLYVGGMFVAAGGLRANHIAKWDGSAWSSLGSREGLDDGVFALALSGTDLYAGGRFTRADGMQVNHVAKWNGSDWSALGWGTGGVDWLNEVYALAVSGADLYVGGSFTTAGGVGANRVAKWNGSAWSALGSGMDGWVDTLAVLGTDLYAGGHFTTAGGVGANHVAKWDGHAWSALGSGMAGYVYALAVSGTDVYAGGDTLRRWNGSVWLPLGSGMSAGWGSPVVFALAVSGSDLYAGGYFTTVGGVSANRVAKWNGTTWSALGSGVDGDVRALAVSGSDLYAGGYFTTAGGKASAYAAKAVLPGFVANDVTYARAPGLSLKIRITDIAWGGNLQSLGASAQGATLSYNSTYIYYLPVNNNDDSFTYTLSNGTDTATGTITVTVVSAFGGLAKKLTVSGGTATIKFFGIPGNAYDVQRTTSLAEPVTWTLLTSTPLSPGPDGLFVYTDASPPSGTAYYRSVQH